MAATLVLAGCALGPQPRYVADAYPEDAEPIAALASIEGTTVGVGDFTRGVDGFTGGEEAWVDLGCADGSAVALPGDRTVEQYQRAALVEELRRAGLYARTDHDESWKNARIVLTGEIYGFSLNSEAAAWETALTIASSRGEQMTITDGYLFERGESEAEFCENAARALAPAVRRVFKIMADSSHFQRYLVPTW